jgi:hypothetical protein
LRIIDHPYVICCKALQSMVGGISTREAVRDFTNNGIFDLCSRVMRVEKKCVEGVK